MNYLLAVQFFAPRRAPTVSYRGHAAHPPPVTVMEPERSDHGRRTARVPAVLPRCRPRQSRAHARRDHHPALWQTPKSTPSAGGAPVGPLGYWPPLTPAWPGKLMAGVINHGRHHHCDTQFDHEQGGRARILRCIRPKSIHCIGPNFSPFRPEKSSVELNSSILGEGIPTDH